MQKISLFILLMAFVYSPVVFSETADEAYAREWVRALLLQQKDKEAQSFVAQKRQESPKSSIYLLLQGQVEISQGKAADAEKTLEQAEKVALENREFLEADEARYLSALASFKQGKADEAQRKMQGLQDERGFQDFITDSLAQFQQSGRQSFLELEHRRLQKQYREQEPVFGASLETGYDSNVALLPDSAGVSRASVYVKPVLSYSQLLYAQGSPLDLSASLGVVDNFASDAQTSDNLPINLRAEWALPGEWGRKHRMSLVNNFSEVFLTYPTMKEFLMGDELALKKVYVLDQDQQIQVNVPLAYNHYPTTSGADDRSGASMGLRVEHFHSLGDYHLSEVAGYNHDFAAGDNYKADDVSLGAGVGTEFIPHLKTRLLLNYNYVNYSSSELGRADAKLGVAAVAGYQFGEFDTALTLNLIENHSNVDVATYSKSVVSAKVSYNF